MTQILSIALVLGILAGAAWTIHRPKWAVVWILVLFPLEQVTFTLLPSLLVHTKVINFLVGGLAVFGVATLAFRRERPTLGYANPATVMVWCLMGLAVLSLAWTPSFETAWDYIRVGLAYYVLLLVLLPFLLRDIGDWSGILTGFMLVGTMICLGVLFNPLADLSGERLQIDVTGFDTRTGHQMSALATGSLGGTVAITAALFRPLHLGQFGLVIRLVAFVVGISMAIASGSRGQVLAAVFCAIVFYPIARPLANPKQFLLSVGGVTCLALTVYVIFQLVLSGEGQFRWSEAAITQATSTRVAAAQQLLAAYLENPTYWLFGLGANAFVAYSSFGGIPYVHNIPVEILCEVGLAGLVLYIGALFYNVRSARTLWHWHAAQPVLRSGLTVLMAIAMYEMLLSLKQGTFIGSGAPLHLLLIMPRMMNYEAVVGLPADPTESPYDRAAEAGGDAAESEAPLQHVEGGWAMPR